MAKTRTEALMEFIDQYLRMAVINTREELEFSVPTSRTELMAMLIHDVWFNIPACDRRTNIAVRSAISLNRKRGANMIPRLDSDVIASHWESVWVHPSDTCIYVTYGWFPHWHFDPPVLVARDTLFLALYSENFMEEGQYSNLRIGYTLERVSQDAFIAALVT